jgi:hypothetical protein
LSTTKFAGTAGDRGVSEAVMTRRAQVTIAAVLGVGACGGRPPEVERTSATASNRADPEVAPPAYEGVTTCEPTPPVAPPVFGFATSDPPSEVQGSLDKNLISRPIRAHFAAFRACYLALLEVDPDAAGHVNARFQIVADGSVTAVEIAGFDRGLDACMCNELLRVQFPVFGSARIGRVVVNYPFVFSR